MKLNFKSGLLIGVVLALLLLLGGNLYTDELAEKSLKISQLDVSNLEYRNLKDEIVELNKIAGGKKVFLNYWATWCKPCLEEFPLLSNVASLAKDEFVFIMVSDQDFDKISKFSKSKDYNFIYLQTDSFFNNGINPIPQSFILDNNMEVKKHHPGPVKGTVNEVIDSLEIWVK